MGVKIPELIILRLLGSFCMFLINRSSEKMYLLVGDCFYHHNFLLQKSAFLWDFPKANK